MKRNFEKILLGILWLMTVTIATTFWMNVRYGFNILSAAHWEYLATLQADRASIRLGFYTSIIIAIMVGLIGLYMIVRPRFRKLKITTQTNPTPQSKQKDLPMVAYQPGTPTRPNMARPLSPTTMHTNVHTSNNGPLPTPTTPNTTYTMPTTPPTANVNPLAHQISNMFESAGYNVKTSKRIGKLISPVVALGYDQSILIGVSHESDENAQDAVGTLVSIFDDTLGNSANDMSVLVCSVEPIGTNTTDTATIRHFATLSEFQEFMNATQNIKPDDFDQDLFDAVSTYINTVITHLGT